MICDNCGGDAQWDKGARQCGQVYDKNYYRKTYGNYRIGIFCSVKCCNDYFDKKDNPEEIRDEPQAN